MTVTGIMMTADELLRLPGTDLARDPDTVRGEPVLPGFSCRLADLF